MTSKPIRVLVVDANPEEVGAMPRRREELEGIGAAGVAHNKKAAIAQGRTRVPNSWNGRHRQMLGNWQTWNPNRIEDPE